MGRLQKIWIKRSTGGPMDPKEGAVLEAGLGLKGNADQGGRRQVSLIEAERWQEVRQELGADVEPVTRRANLLISGVRLADTRGRILKIGDTRLRIWTETRPCRQMEEAHPGLQEALKPDWRGGACAEVLAGGEIRVGDEVDWANGGGRTSPYSSSR